MSDALVKQRYTYVGELVVEVVVAASEGSISTDVNVLPSVSPAGAVSQTGNMPPALETPVEPNPLADPVALPQPLAEPVLMATAPPHGRGFYAVLRFFYTSLACILGMAGASAKYLLDHLSDLSDINWTVVGIAVAGALLAGVLYGLKKYYRPDPNSLF